MQCKELKRIVNKKGDNIKIYIDIHPIEEDNSTVKYMRDQIQNVQIMIKLNKVNNG